MLLEITSKFVKNKYILFVLFYVLFSVVFLIDLRTKINLSTVSYEQQIFIGMLGVILPVIMLFIYFFLEKYEIKIEKMFLVLALVLGLFYIIAAPLFTGSDEHNHYYRIYEIVDGTLITPVQFDGIVGSTLPKSLCDMYIGSNLTNLEIYRNLYIRYPDESRMLNVELNPNEKMQYGTHETSEYTNTALYNPIQYLPQIIGFSFGRLFNLRPFIIGELGRLFNLIFFAFLGYIFLNKMPYMKEYFALILLTPTLLSCATTLSADAFTNILIFGLLAYVSYYYNDSNVITTKHILVFFLISIFIASCKIVYLPFIFLLFLIPINSFKSKKHKYLTIIPILIVSVVISLIWMKIAGVYLDVYYVGSQLQKMSIIHNIGGYLIIVLRTYFWNFLSLILNVFGSTDMYHSQLNVYLFLPIMYLYVVIVTIFNSVKNGEGKLEKPIYYINIILLFGMELLLIATAIYIQCRVNYVIMDDNILGLQGRYYVPLILLLPLFIKSKDQEINYHTLGFVSIINICVLMQMVFHFMV